MQHQNKNVTNVTTEKKLFFRRQIKKLLPPKTIPRQNVWRQNTTNIVVSTLPTKHTQQQ
jgi:hypothetical protein